MCSNLILILNHLYSTDGSNTGEEYQQEFKPPPEGSATGVGKQERVIPAKDASHDQEQIQHR